MLLECHKVDMRFRLPLTLKALHKAFLTVNFWDLSLIYSELLTKRRHKIPKTIPTGSNQGEKKFLWRLASSCTLRSKPRSTIHKVYVSPAFLQSR